jgi:Family of unknown function (DUF6526)
MGISAAPHLLPDARRNSVGPVRAFVASFHPHGEPMATSAPQSLGNHARYVPFYHLVLALLIATNLAHAVMELRVYSREAVFQLIVALSLTLMYWYVRAFPVTVQDRVIRLEMQLRLQHLAPGLMDRFGELGVQQLTALRFAGDDELPALAGDVIEGRLRSPAEIKRSIQHWKPDHLRA